VVDGRESVGGESENKLNDEKVPMDQVPPVVSIASSPIATPTVTVQQPAQPTQSTQKTQPVQPTQPKVNEKKLGANATALDFADRLESLGASPVAVSPLTNTKNLPPLTKVSLTAFPATSITKTNSNATLPSNVPSIGIKSSPSTTSPTSIDTKKETNSSNQTQRSSVHFKTTPGRNGDDAESEIEEEIYSYSDDFAAQTDNDNEEEDDGALDFSDISVSALPEHSTDAF
jgi:hypothetical protein